MGIDVGLSVPGLPEVGLVNRLDASLKRLSIDRREGKPNIGAFGSSHDVMDTRATTFAFSFAPELQYRPPFKELWKIGIAPSVAAGVRIQHDRAHESRSFEFCRVLILEHGCEARQESSDFPGAKPYDRRTKATVVDPYVAANFDAQLFGPMFTNLGAGYNFVTKKVDFRLSTGVRFP